MRKKPAPPGLLRRCEYPPCLNLTDSGKYCCLDCLRAHAALKAQTGMLRGMGAAA